MANGEKPGYDPDGEKPKNGKNEPPTEGSDRRSADTKNEDAGSSVPKISDPREFRKALRKANLKSQGPMSKEEAEAMLKTVRVPKEKAPIEFDLKKKKTAPPENIALAAAAETGALSAIMNAKEEKGQRESLNDAESASLKALHNLLELNAPTATLPEGLDIDILMTISERYHSAELNSIMNDITDISENKPLTPEAAQKMRDTLDSFIELHASTSKDDEVSVSIDTGLVPKTEETLGTISGIEGSAAGSTPLPELATEPDGSPWAHADKNIAAELTGDGALVSREAQTKNPEDQTDSIKTEASEKEVPKPKGDWEKSKMLGKMLEKYEQAAKELAVKFTKKSRLAPVISKFNDDGEIDISDADLELLTELKRTAKGNEQHAIRNLIRQRVLTGLISFGKVPENEIPLLKEMAVEHAEYLISAEKELKRKRRYSDELKYQEIIERALTEHVSDQPEKAGDPIHANEKEAEVGRGAFTGSTEVKFEDVQAQLNQETMSPEDGIKALGELQAAILKKLNAERGKDKKGAIRPNERRKLVDDLDKVNARLSELRRSPGSAKKKTEIEALPATETEKVEEVPVPAAEVPAEADGLPQPEKKSQERGEKKGGMIIRPWKDDEDFARILGEVTARGGISGKDLQRTAVLEFSKQYPDKARNLLSDHYGREIAHMDELLGDQNLTQGERAVLERQRDKFRNYKDGISRVVEKKSKPRIAEKMPPQEKAKGWTVDDTAAKDFLAGLKEVFGEGWNKPKMPDGEISPPYAKYFSELQKVMRIDAARLKTSEKLHERIAEHEKNIRDINSLIEENDVAGTKKEGLQQKLSEMNGYLSRAKDDLVVFTADTMINGDAEDKDTLHAKHVFEDEGGMVPGVVKPGVSFSDVDETRRYFNKRLAETDEYLKKEGLSDAEIITGMHNRKQIMKYLEGIEESVQWRKLMDMRDVLDQAYPEQNPLELPEWPDKDAKKTAKKEANEIKKVMEGTDDEKKKKAAQKVEKMEKDAQAAWKEGKFWKYAKLGLALMFLVIGSTFSALAEWSKKKR